jgi:hypothetical protein
MKRRDVRSGGSFRFLTIEPRKNYSIAFDLFISDKQAGVARYRQKKEFVLHGASGAAVLL